MAETAEPSLMLNPQPRPASARPVTVQILFATAALLVAVIAVYLVAFDTPVGL